MVEVLASLKERIGLPGLGPAGLTEQTSGSEMLSQFGYLPETPTEVVLLHHDPSGLTSRLSMRWSR